jgi:ornithine carbamoyltransferase
VSVVDAVPSAAHHEVVPVQRHPGSLLKTLDLDKGQFLALMGQARELKAAKAAGAEHPRRAENRMHTIEAVMVNALGS